jgi:hypothetical protein
LRDTDIIKEIRDASRIKEEAMLSKLKVIMECQQEQKSLDLELLKVSEGARLMWE